MEYYFAYEMLCQHVPGEEFGFSFFTKESDRGEQREELGRAAHVKRSGEVPYVYSICYNNNNNDNDNVMRVEYTLLGAAHQPVSLIVFRSR